MEEEELVCSCAERGRGEDRTHTASGSQQQQQEEGEEGVQCSKRGGQGASTSLPERSGSGCLRIGCALLPKKVREAPLHTLALCAGGEGEGSAQREGIHGIRHPTIPCIIPQMPNAA